MQNVGILRQPLLGDLVTVGRTKKKIEIPKIVAYLSCSSGHTHSARTNLKMCSEGDSVAPPPLGMQNLRLSTWLTLSAY